MSATFSLSPSCLRRQASHFIHHACDGQLSAAPPMLVMPAKAGIAFHPPCLRRNFQAEQELSSACGSRATFSLRAQRESSQRERAPRGGAFRPSMDGKSVSRGRAFRAGSCPREKARPSMASPAARPDRPRLTAAEGPRVEQRAILARTRCATAARLREQGAVAKGTSSIGLEQPSNDETIPLVGVAYRPRRRGRSCQACSTSSGVIASRSARKALSEYLGCF